MKSKKNILRDITKLKKELEKNKLKVKYILDFAKLDFSKDITNIVDYLNCYYFISQILPDTVNIEKKIFTFSKPHHYITNMTGFISELLDASVYSLHNYIFQLQTFILEQYNKLGEKNNENN